jgi:predicted nucleic acid-binding protein
MTMLGAVLATLVTLLVAARLPRWSRKGSIYDSRVSDGKILIGVANAPERSQRELERRLREAGAEDVVSTS